jgi:DNA replication and repair protein RecF
MHVARVTVRDFRNYERGEVELRPGVTVACGPNGAGKTNLLEAVYFGLTGRSCRTSNEREMVRHDAGPARVAATVVDGGERHVLEAAFDRREGKRLRVDGSPARGAAPLSVRPPVAVFVPERLELVKGAPAHRRAHVDRLVAAVWPARAEDRAAYGRALGQRNALLARVRAGAASPGALDTWDDQLARCGIAVIEQRAEAVDRLSPGFAARALELGLPGAAISYRPRSRAPDAAALTRELEERRSLDLERGFTTHGPHRDDLVLAVDGRPLRSYGSQGQQRLGVVALLLAERDLLAGLGRPPLLLLDDAMSELDAARRERLSRAILAGGQALVTATDPAHLAGAEVATVVEVEAGSLRAPPHAVAA